VLIDTDPPLVGEAVLMVGAVAGQLELGASDADIRAASITFTVIAGRVDEFAEQADGYRGIPMWSANIQTLGGMSGGPVLRRRHRRVVTATSQETFVAIGIVSRSRYATGMLLNDINIEKTWFSPMSTATEYQSIQTLDGRIRVSEAISRGILTTFQNDPGKQGMI
jgi:hypothetical protein